MKKVFKYATGDVIPEGAIHLKTVVQTEVDARQLDYDGAGHVTGGTVPYWKKCWLVWHYFLVEVKE
ncbi:MAG: hypothetical protein WBO32_01095 [Cyclobacteriaceae bacterium]